MQYETKVKSGKLDFNHLPAFAGFILAKHHQEFVVEQLRLSKEVNIPLLALLEPLGEKKIMELSLSSSAEFLTYLKDNQAQKQIDDSFKRWMSDKLPVLTREQIVTEDITLVNYIRRQAFLHFIPLYTEDIPEIMNLIREIDLFLLESETISANGYIRLLKNKINEELYFKEKITNTTPGIVYVFDLKEEKTVYSNDKVAYYLGYGEDERMDPSDLLLEKFMHVDDIQIAKSHLAEVANLKDQEVKTFEYRAKTKNGTYRWLRAYESVFRRTIEGEVWQIIGIATDIHNEKQIEQQLFYRESQLLEAQELAQLGSYEWDLVNGTSESTPQIKNILEIVNLPLEAFIEHVHPQDRLRVQEALQKAMEETGIYDCEFRYQISGKEKVLWSRGLVSFDEMAKPVVMRGTIMDVTERHVIIQRLQTSEELFKQAQATTHIGNYVWDASINRYNWSDELYRIYGMEPGSPIDRETIAALNHPDDKDLVRKAIQRSAETGEAFDFHYRIVLKDGSIKILHARGKAIIQNGQEKILGTAQDVTERQHLIDRLQKSDELYKQAQAISHIGNWTYNLATNKTYWTDEMFRIYGLEPQSREISWEGFLEMVHPQDRALVQGFATQAIKARAPFEMYHRNLLNDGTVKTLHIRGEVVVGEDQKPQQLFGTAQDVTTQHRTEQELRDNRNFIQKIADATPSIIASYNINTGKYRFVSRGLETLLGYDPAIAMEKGVEFFVKLIHPDDLGPMMAKNMDALQAANESETELNDIIIDWQYRMLHKDGSYRWFHTFGTIFDRNREGKVEHVLNISIDITDKIEAEKKVVEQEMFIKHIADSSPTVLYLFDTKQGKVVYINREIESVLGYNPDEMIGLGNQIIPLLYHPEDAAMLKERLHEYNNAQQPQSLFQFECRMKHKNGEWRWLLIREIVFKRDTENKILEVLGSALDISHRKDIETMLIQKTRELEQSNASLEEFAYVASHDLKEPLRKISTFGDRLMAAHKANLNEEGKEYLEKIVHSSKRMQLMINDLLSISMISGEKTFERFSLQTILDEVVQTLEYKIEEHKAILEIDPLPEAWIIPSQFRQLFQNLMSNSLKFIRTGVQPRIVVRHRYIRPSQVKTAEVAKANEYLQINFEDNGIGFDKAFSEKIFAIFQRLHSKSEYEGTGIGLSICRKIIENHGGTIVAAGVPNQGAKFTIILPV
ncbi:MAG TPA: PAS domain-containing protein [Flavitalea sp.]|nr:PAS domain-containing protein [Flavitalea sp.]